MSTRFLYKPNEGSSKIDITIVIAIIISYYFVRFFLGQVSFIFLGALIIMVFFASLRARSLLSSDFLVMFLFMAPPLLAIPYCMYIGDPLAANYFVIYFLALFARSVGKDIFRSRRHRQLQLMVISYIIVCIIFIAIPSLQSFSTHVLSAGELNSSLYVTEQTHGSPAFFYHPGEFGAMSAGLIMILWGSANENRKKVWIFSLDAVLILFLTAFVVYVRSTTGLFIVLVVFAYHSPLAGVEAIGLPFLFLMQALSQFEFSGPIAGFLQTGSFWWRYNMADGITSSASFITFSPDLIDKVGNWPHSFVMDYCLSFGKLPAIIFVLAMVATSWRTRSRGLRVMLSLFSTVASVSPIGSGPTMMFFALICGYAGAVPSKPAKDASPEHSDPVTARRTTLEAAR